MFIGGRKIPRLQERNNKFYLRKKDPENPDEPAKRIPLEATTAQEAADESAGLHNAIKKGKIRISDLMQKGRETEEKAEPAKQPKGNTFSEISQGYLEDCKTKKIRSSTLRCYVGDLKTWEEAFGGWDLSEINQKEISSVVRGWRRESEEEEYQISNYRIRKRLHTLYRVFGWAVDEERLDRIPFELRFLKKLVGKIETKGERRLLKDEELNLLITRAKETNGRSLGYVLADIIELTASSGLREGEAFPLRWRQVNFEQEVLVVEKGKTTNAARKINFNPILKSVLKRIYKDAEDKGETGQNDFLFKTNYRLRLWRKTHPNDPTPPVSNLTRLLNRVAEKAGLAEFAKDPNREGLHSQENLGFHDFRRFFITKCLHGGVPLPTIARWVGHRDGGVLILKTYVQNDEELARKYANELTLWKQTKKR